ncbi:hypothetical protein C2845_PM17G07080 [Panicum miliaceum]|uniref:Uncharacterized protein n=1 Tax=Panicum miliaceum TaxID=4540 RepID=A0A3L6Q1A9_PANMI|nr:hypothetical protein C2845_PM17G07080 [Panicum miliaceum]
MPAARHRRPPGLQRPSPATRSSSLTAAEHEYARDVDTRAWSTRATPHDARPQRSGGVARAALAGGTAEPRREAGRRHGRAGPQSRAARPGDGEGGRWSPEAGKVRKGVAASLTWAGKRMEWRACWWWCGEAAARKAAEAIGVPVAAVEQEEERLCLLVVGIARARRTCTAACPLDGEMIR